MKNNKDLTRTKTSDYSPQISKDTPVQYVKGVGPARAALLKRLGIETIEDILFYFPWRYEDRKNLKKICDLSYGKHETALCEVVSSDIITTPRRRMKIFELTVTDETGSLKSKWFNQPYLKKYFQKGQKVILSGVVKGNPYTRIGLEMENPDFELFGNEDKLIHTSRIVPVYKATEGLSPKQIRTLMFNTTSAYSFVV
ncbi:MAG: DNA helicase RecG, partial [Nitrospirae bacterium]|nr:DNA helicase RecG [Nitrospirota bacterium]